MNVHQQQGGESTGARSLEIVSSLDGVRDDWLRLAEETRNVFSTWEWASTWWRHLGGERSALVVTCRGDRGVTVVLPLYLWSERPVRVARFIGHGPADQLGPICAPAEHAMAAAALEGAAERAGLDVLVAELLAGGQGWAGLLDDRPLRAEPSPTLSIEGGWEAYLATRSPNFRQQIRRRERSLRRRHTVRFRLVADPDRLQDDLTVLFSLHRARWAGSPSAFTRFEPFHRDFAAVALERGWLRLWFLELDQRPVAAWYGFRFANVESYYQAGREPQLSDESVGFILLAHSIREAAADGMHEYRLLRGAETFKLRFADDDRGVETFALAHGITGGAARVATAAAFRSATIRSVLRQLRL